MFRLTAGIFSIWPASVVLIAAKAENFAPFEEFLQIVPYLVQSASADPLGPKSRRRSGIRQSFCVMLTYWLPMPSSQPMPEKIGQTQGYLPLKPKLRIPNPVFRKTCQMWNFLPEVRRNPAKRPFSVALYICTWAVFVALISGKNIVAYQLLTPCQEKVSEHFTLPPLFFCVTGRSFEEIL